MIREGIELTSDFTATINVDLKVGALEETLTVTGESPIVDTQSITQRVVMTRKCATRCRPAATSRRSAS